MLFIIISIGENLIFHFLVPCVPYILQFKTGNTGYPAGPTFGNTPPPWDIGNYYSEGELAVQ